MNPAIHSISYTPEVAALLALADLPTDDLPNPNTELFGCVQGQSLAGVVGLEVVEHAALLRSLAVDFSGRNTGLGIALVQFAEQQAVRRKLHAIHLLTTTAAHFFEKRGYSHTARANAPPGILATRQFSSLCPAASAHLVKLLE